MREYIVGENQQQHYCFIFDQTTGLHNIHLRFYVERNAVLLVEIFIANVTLDIIIDCVLQGEGAGASIKGVYMADALHKVTMFTMQHHKVGHAQSKLIMKGIVRDNAQAHYHGTIRVEKEAHGTYTSQENKNILLSNGARVISVPNLEVLAHDVRCFHASAIGRFDEKQLLYAASRGIDEKVAQRLLLHAFIADIFVNEGLKDRLNDLIAS